METIGLHFLFVYQSYYKKSCPFLGNFALNQPKLIPKLGKSPL